MDLKSKIIAGTVVIAVSFASGYYMAPEKVKIETKLVETDKKTDKKEDNIHRNKQTVIIKTKLPDGTVKQVTTISDVTNTQETQKDTDVLAKTEDTTKEVTKSSKKLNIAALAGVNPFSGPPQMIYGAHVQTSLIGPIMIGVFGMTNGTVGASLGLSF